MCSFTPIVYEPIQRVERVDTVPSMVWDVDRVARLQCRRLRRLHGLREARVALEIRVRELDHAHRRAGRRELDGPRVEILDLLWREQCEAPAARDDAADILHQIV